MRVGEMNQTERTIILAKGMELLKEKYNIYHSTIQMVSEKEMKEIDMECEHCN